MPLQMAGLTVWPNFTAKAGELLSDPAKGLVELDVLALDRQHPTRLRPPRQYINVRIVPVERPTKQPCHVSLINLLSNFPTGISHSGSHRGVELQALHVICVPYPFAPIRGPCL